MPSSRAFRDVTPAQLGLFSRDDRPGHLRFLSYQQLARGDFRPGTGPASSAPRRILTDLQAQCRLLSSCRPPAEEDGNAMPTAERVVERRFVSLSSECHGPAGRWAAPQGGIRTRSSLARRRTGSHDRCKSSGPFLGHYARTGPCPCIRLPEFRHALCLFQDHPRIVLGQGAGRLTLVRNPGA
jgi:hypothetical protein